MSEIVGASASPLIAINGNARGSDGTATSGARLTANTNATAGKRSPGKGTEVLVAAMDAIRAGARGYVMKRESTKKIIGAIHEVLRGNLYLSKEMTELLVEALNRCWAPYFPDEPPLTPTPPCGMGLRSPPTCCRAPHPTACAR